MALALRCKKEETSWLQYTSRAFKDPPVTPQTDLFSGRIIVSVAIPYLTSFCGVSGMESGNYAGVC